MIDEEKYNHSLEVLRLASQMSEQYYKKPLLITYSGGKDSDVLLQLALESGIKFEVQNSHTTVDAPQTVYHVREVFRKLNEQGINAEVTHARYKDGRLITMWNLIEKKKGPPTNRQRFCCKALKETTTPNRFIATGVRRDESSRRAKREEFLVRAKNNEGKWYKGKTLTETTEVYKEAQENDEVYDCLFITQAKKNMDLVCNPILHWTEDDVWNFIKDRNIKVCELYNMGFKRVGCVGCPLASLREREREFEIFPIYKENYIKAFDRMDKSNMEKAFRRISEENDRKGVVKTELTGKDIYDWWMYDPRFYGQTELEGWRDGEE